MRIASFEKEFLMKSTVSLSGYFAEMKAFWLLLLTGFWIACWVVTIVWMVIHDDGDQPNSQANKTLNRIERHAGACKARADRIIRGLISSRIPVRQ